MKKHQFKDRLDRYCEICNRPDRDEIHKLDDIDLQDEIQDHLACGEYIQKLDLYSPGVFVARLNVHIPQDRVARMEQMIEKVIKAYSKESTFMILPPEISTMERERSAVDLKIMSRIVDLVRDLIDFMDTGQPGSPESAQTIDELRQLLLNENQEA